MWLTWFQALEEGEDIQELSERTRKSRATNKLLKDAEMSNRGTPVSDNDVRGRKGKKGKSKVPDFDSGAGSGSKRKRGGMKSMSVTPSINGEDEDEPDMVRISSYDYRVTAPRRPLTSRNGAKQRPVMATFPQVFGSR